MLKTLGKLIRDFYKNLKLCDGVDIMLAFLLAGLSTAFLFLWLSLVYLLVEEFGTIGIMTSLAFVVFFIFFINRV